jgi:hypothetical protein
MAFGGDLEAEIESEIITAQIQSLQTKYYETKYSKQKQVANAEYVKNMTEK